MVKSAVSKSVKPLLKELKEVTEKAEEAAENGGDTNLKDALKPLVGKAEDIEDEVKKAEKVRKDIGERVEKVGEDIEDAHKSISSAAKGAATSSTIEGAQKD